VHPPNVNPRLDSRLEGPPWRLAGTCSAREGFGSSWLFRPSRPKTITHHAQDCLGTITSTLQQSGTRATGTRLRGGDHGSAGHLRVIRPQASDLHGCVVAADSRTIGTAGGLPAINGGVSARYCRLIDATDPHCHLHSVHSNLPNLL